MNLTANFYKNKCKEYAMEIWGTEFNLPVEVSGRMTRAMGKYTYRKDFMGNITPIRLRFSTYLNGYTEETRNKIIKHELCHWYLSITGKQFGDFDYDFKKEIKRIGSILTHHEPEGEMHFITCSCCGKIAGRKHTQKAVMKYTNGRYTSRCCGRILVYAGKHLNIPGMEYINDQNTGTIQEVAIEVNEPKQNKINEGAKKMEDVKNVKVENVETTKNSENLVEKNSKGKVSNKQMIPAIKENIDNKGNLEILKADYPDIFTSSLKYIGKRNSEKLEKMGV